MGSRKGEIPLFVEQMDERKVPSENEETFSLNESCETDFPEDPQDWPERWGNPIQTPSWKDQPD